MNVGQVEFSVSSDTLKSVLESAKELESILNRIDKSTYGAKGGGVANVGKGAINATKKVVDEEEKAIMTRHKLSEKGIRDQMKIRKQDAKNKDWADRVERGRIKTQERNTKAWWRNQKSQAAANKKFSDSYDKYVNNLLDNFKKEVAAKDELEHHDENLWKQAEENVKQFRTQAEADLQDVKKNYEQFSNSYDAIVNKQVDNIKKESTAKSQEEKLWEEAALNVAKFRADTIQNLAKSYVTADEYRARLQQGLVNTGAQLQTLGATIQRLTSPFADIYKGLLYGVGYRALGMVTDSISGAFSRYDTITTYSKVLTHLGVDATKKFSVAGQEATDVYHNLENAVLGLPTGIDEIIESMRRYAGATGEAERATKLAIAANNAYVAGHMGDREKLFTERQLVALAGGATLSSNQWDSLRRNAPLAMKVVAQDMKMSVQDMVSALKEGEISGQRFLNVFIKAGTEGRIKDAANEMKVTWDAVAQNVRNRLNAMGEGILNTLNEVFTAMDGRSFLQHVLGFDKDNNYIKGQGIRGLIDDLSESAQKWVRANPRKILDFFDALQSINWKGIVSGFAQMGMYLGKFYLGLAKVAGMGNGNLIKWMVNLNVLGKIIQGAGGLIKGTAGISSFIATAARYHFGHGGGRIAQFFMAINEAGKGAEAMAITWQGVASKAVTIAAIPALAWSLREVALALQEFGKVNINWLTLANNLAQAGVALTAFGGLAAAFGALMTSGPIGWISTLSVGVGTAAIAGISKTMSIVGEGLNAIANAKIPKADKIGRVMETVTEIEKYFKARNPFDAIGRIFDSWTKTAEFKSIKNMGQAFESIVNVATFKLPKGWKTKAKKRFESMKDFVDGLEGFFDYVEEGRKGASGQTTSPLYRGNKSRYSSWYTEVKSFADVVSSIGSTFNGMTSMIDNAVALHKKIVSLRGSMPSGMGEEGFSFGVLRGNLETMANELYKLVQMENGQSMMDKFKNISDKFQGIHLDNVLSQLDQIPSLITRLNNIKNKIAVESRNGRNAVSNNSLKGIAGGLKPIFLEIGRLQKIIPTDLSKFDNLTKINTAIARIKRTIVKLRELRAMGTDVPSLDSIRGVAGAIKSALGELESIGDKEVTVNLESNIKGQEQVKSDTQKAIAKLKRQILTLPATVDKNVNVHLTSKVTGIQAAVAGAKSGLDAAMAAIRRLDSTVRKTVHVNIGGHASRVHTGGKVGSPLYRAGGGSVFQPSGTDVIPAMLSEGEYVIQSMAARAIGDNVLQKLNHMDIAGAIKGLYEKVGNVSTVNNTKNANLTINNYKSADVGYVKGNRWLQKI